MRVDVVIPTSGRPSLGPLLEALEGFPLGEVIVSEDRDGRGPAPVSRKCTTRGAVS